MTGFSVVLRSATQHERLEEVVSFVGEDASGSFGLMRGHGRFVTALVFGLARLRYADGRWDYLALPQAVACFERDELTLSTRRFLRGDDHLKISQQLREELIKEEKTLLELKHSLEMMERSMLLRLWRMGRNEEAAR
jgi:F-type H+-transporting ATPase subunit epsilon